MKEENKPTHVAYSDEAYYLNSGYGSISMISLKVEDLDNLNQKIKNCLESSGVKEFKWESTGSAKYRFCAKKMIDIVFEFAKQKKIRIDTIIWNSNKRKEFLPEGDLVILGKMYYHLYKNVLTKRWPKSNWKLYPDKQTAIDWNEISKILKNVSSELIIKNDSGGKLQISEKSRYQIIELSEIDSKESCLCQITDLFSGLAAYYHLESHNCNLSPYQNLLDRSNRNASNKDLERYGIIEHLKQKSKKSSMEIIFDSLKGLRTHNPNNSINFWQFEIKQGRHNNQKLSKFI